GAGALDRPEQRSAKPRAQLEQAAIASSVGADLEQFQAAAAGIERSRSQPQLVGVDTNDVDELLCQDGHGYLHQGDQRRWSAAPPGGDPVRGHAIGRTSSLLSQRMAEADTSGGPGGHLHADGMRSHTWRALRPATLP